MHNSSPEFPGYLVAASAAEVRVLIDGMDHSPKPAKPIEEMYTREFQGMLQTHGYSTYRIDGDGRLVGVDFKEHPFVQIRPRELPIAAAATRAFLETAPRVRMHKQRKVARTMLSEIYREEERFNDSLEDTLSRLQDHRI